MHGDKGVHVSGLRHNIEICNSDVIMNEYNIDARENNSICSENVHNFTYSIVNIVSSYYLEIKSDSMHLGSSRCGRSLRDMDADQCGQEG